MLKGTRQGFRYLQYRAFHITFIKEEVDGPEHKVSKICITCKL